MGPGRGLRRFADVPNLHVLVCGGDGTVGWVISVMDELGLSAHQIPVAVLPVGTGNDLARSFKFGGGYAGENLVKFLQRLADAIVMPFDRWDISALPNTSDTACSATGSPLQGDGVSTVLTPTTRLPQTVMNNYFSVGTDALTALRFHAARENDPSSFTSRFKNKLKYGALGAKEVFAPQHKELSASVTLTCDGKDFTELLRKKKVQSVAVMNVPSYAGGTHPWGTKQSVEGFRPLRIDDGLLEVVGFESAADLGLAQLKIGHAIRICQCSEIELSIAATLPVQVDGEPCLLRPSTISISHRNQVPVLVRRAGRFRSDSSVSATSRPPAPIPGLVFARCDPLIHTLLVSCSPV